MNECFLRELATNLFFNALLVLHILEFLLQLLQAVRLAFELLLEFMDGSHSGFGFALPSFAYEGRELCI
jgi:hypothetical protein